MPLPRSSTSMLASRSMAPAYLKSEAPLARGFVVSDSPESDCPERHEVCDRCGFQFLLVTAQGVDGGALARREAAGDGLLELVHQHRDALGAALAVADGERHLHSLGLGATLEEHLDGVADVALGRVVVVLGELAVLALHRQRHPEIGRA